MQTPIPHSSVTSPEDVPRKIFCTHYGSCQDYTLEMKWQGFSCEACHGYEMEPGVADQYRDDALRGLKMIYFVQGAKVGHRRRKRTIEEVERDLLDYFRHSGAVRAGVPGFYEK